MARIRTFVAVELSPQVRSKAAELSRRLTASGAEIRWVEAQNLHLTLNFLGDVDERELNDVCKAVTQAAAEVEAFEVLVKGAGAFPSAADPKTLWLGLDQGREEFMVLQQAIERALAKLGFPKDKRFHPHITLGRLKRFTSAAGSLQALLAANAEFEAGVTTVDEVVIFSSQLERSGPIYHLLASAPLA